MAEVGEKGEAGDADFALVVPRAVFVLRFLKIAEGLDDGVLAFPGAAGGG